MSNKLCTFSILIQRSIHSDFGHEIDWEAVYIFSVVVESTPSKSKTTTEFWVTESKTKDWVPSNQVEDQDQVLSIWDNFAVSKWQKIVNSLKCFIFVIQATFVGIDSQVPSPTVIKTHYQVQDQDIDIGTKTSLETF